MKFRRSSLKTNQNRDDKNINVMKVITTCLLIGLVVIFLKENASLIFLSGCAIYFASFGGSMIFSLKLLKTSIKSTLKKDLFYLLILNLISLFVYVAVYTEFEISKVESIDILFLSSYTMVLGFIGYLIAHLTFPLENIFKDEKDIVMLVTMVTGTIFGVFFTVVWLIQVIEVGTEITSFYPIFGIIFGSSSIIIGVLFSKGKKVKMIKYSLVLLIFSAILFTKGVEIASMMQFVESIWLLEHSKGYIIYLVIGSIIGLISIITDSISSKKEMEVSIKV